MKSLINDVKDLFEKLLVRSKKLDEIKEKLKVDTEKVSLESGENKKLKIELDGREKAIKSIEDVVKLKDEVAVSYRSLSSDKKVFKREKNAFDEEKERDSKEIKAQKEANSSKTLKLQKAQLALDKDKETYKQKVMKEINENIEKQKVKI